MNVKIKRQIQHLRFINRVFLGKHHNLEFAEFELMNFVGAILNHSAVIEFSAEIVAKKCEVTP